MELSTHLQTWLKAEEDHDIFGAIVNAELEDSNTDITSGARNEDLRGDMTEWDKRRSQQRQPEHRELVRFAVSCMEMRDRLSALPDALAHDVRAGELLTMLHKMERQCVHTAALMRQNNRQATELQQENLGNYRSQIQSHVTRLV